MTTFDDRERGYEARFAHDQEQAFRAQARRDKLLGRWMGEQLGHSAEALEDYVLSVWRADLKEPGDADVLAKLLADAQGAGLALSEADIRAKMDACLSEATAELAREG